MFRLRGLDLHQNGDDGCEDRLISLRDGRVIGYRVFGDPDGYPVLALHGTPGSRFKYAGAHAAAVANGLRVIAPDRWGYGLTSPKPGGRIADYGDDMEALADALMIGAFHVTGVSGGGPFAVATAAKLKERVTALALVSPVGLLNASAGPVELSPFHTLCFRMAPRVPGALAMAFYSYRAALRVAPELAMWIAVARSTKADQDEMRDDGVRARLIRTFESGLEPGIQGPLADMALFDRPWAIDLRRVSAPVRIWIGLDDRNVPLSGVRALHHALEQSECIELPDAGHLWVSRNEHVVMAWLGDLSGSSERARQL